jgi:hypothetical protein
MFGGGGGGGGGGWGELLNNAANICDEWKADLQIEED